MTATTSASIIVNNFNYGRFLRQAIDSALNQTWPQVEVIVVDDGSTDDSREILTSYGQRVTAVLQPNGGQGSAFNAGFAVSSGDVVYFLDSDDEYLPNTVEKSLPLVMQPGVVKAHWPVIQIDEYGVIQQLSRHAPLAQGDLGGKALLWGPASHETPPSSANAWSRAFLNLVMPLDESIFTQHADTWLFSTSPFCGEIALAREPLSLYRMHGQNHSTSEPVAKRLALWEERAELLQHWLAGRGIEASIEEWRTNNRHYQSLVRKAAAEQAADTPLETSRTQLPAE